MLDASAPSEPLEVPAPVQQFADDEIALEPVETLEPSTEDDDEDEEDQDEETSSESSEPQAGESAQEPDQDAEAQASGDSERTSSTISLVAIIAGAVTLLAGGLIWFFGRMSGRASN